MAETRGKPWLKQPGELHDMRGVPIYPGDLLRSFHFKERSGRTHYLYHTAVYAFDKDGKHGHMRIVPTSHLEPSKVSGGGDCLLSEDLAATCRVISGCGPGDCLDYADRPRKRRTVLHDKEGEVER